jgi:hypothetical protein
VRPMPARSPRARCCTGWSSTLSGERHGEHLRPGTLATRPPRCPGGHDVSMTWRPAALITQSRPSMRACPPVTLRNYFRGQLSRNIRLIKARGRRYGPGRDGSESGRNVEKSRQAGSLTPGLHAWLRLGGESVRSADWAICSLAGLPAPDSASEWARIPVASSQQRWRQVRRRHRSALRPA